MQAEPSSPKFFFDDEDVSIRFEFQPADERLQKDLQFPSILKTQLLIKDTSTDQYHSKHFTLHNKIIAKNKSHSELTPESILDLSFSRLKYINPEEGTPYTGFSLTKNAITHSFYSADKQVIDDWYQALKKICVLLTFHEDYKAIKMIGRGSFAKVYLVESKTTGKSYAVKAFAKETTNVTNKNNAKPSLLNEIDIMRDLDHDNVIRLHEVYESEKSIYLIMDLIQGKSLYEFLKKSNFREEVSQTRIVNIVRSLLDALAYLASKGIMHRDLKPDNILLDRGEKVKLVDFGLATFINVPNYIFKKCGTPGYIAPEVFRYDDKTPTSFYDDRCDVFSVGCLLYYMLYSTPMFEGSTAVDILKANRKYSSDSQLLHNIKQEFKDPNKKISKDGLNLLLDLIESNPKKRVSAAQAMTHSFFIPAPSGMQKIVGTNEFVVEALLRSEMSEICSPSSPLKYTEIVKDQVYSPLTPLTPLTPRLDTFDQASPLLPGQRDRFIREDSLYLDVGRPEITGRIDTITSGSMSGSLLLSMKGDSSSNVGTTTTPSSFANRNVARTGSKTYKSHNQGASNQSFLKQAIFRTMQKNNSEGLREARDEDSFKSRVEELKLSGAPYEALNTEAEDQGQEKIQIRGTPEKDKENQGKEGGSNEKKDSKEKAPGKHGVSKNRRFHPFSPGNLIIPKNEVSSNF